MLAMNHGLVALRDVLFLILHPSPHRFTLLILIRYVEARILLALVPSLPQKILYSIVATT